MKAKRNMLKGSKLTGLLLALTILVSAASTGCELEDGIGATSGYSDAIYYGSDDLGFSSGVDTSVLLDNYMWEQSFSNFNYYPSSE